MLLLRFNVAEDMYLIVSQISSTHYLAALFWPAWSSPTCS